MRVVGVDAGKKGALAILDGPELVDIRDLPLDDFEELDSAQIFSWLLDAEVDRLLVEDCFRPHSLVRFVGEVTAVAKVLSIDCRRVAVVHWKKWLLGENTSDKRKSIAVCQKLYPEADLIRPGCRTPSADRAEAILLARYGLEAFGDGKVND